MASDIAERLPWSPCFGVPGTVRGCLSLIVILAMPSAQMIYTRGLVAMLLVGTASHSGLGLYGSVTEVGDRGGSDALLMSRGPYVDDGFVKTEVV